jgi:hypothetical protein
MQQSAGELNEVFKTLNTPALLYKAYYSGEISYTELFTEYDNYNQTLLYLENLYLKLTSLHLELYVLSAQ